MRTAAIFAALCLICGATPVAGQSIADAALVELPTTAAEPLLQTSHFAKAKGDFRIVPYGTFWSDMVYSTRRTNPGSFTLFVFSEQDQGEPAFALDARRSRFGFDVTGPPIAAATPLQSGGRLEIDFQGEFVVENRAEVLLRHAYWEVSNDQHRFLIGQNWDVISPLIPRTVNYAYGYFAGNLGFRRAQFRYDHTVALSDNSRFTLQGSLNQDIVADFASDPGVGRESANWPVVEARAALSLDPAAGRDAVTLGLSGHIGETGFDFTGTGPPPRSLPPADERAFQRPGPTTSTWRHRSANGPTSGRFFRGATSAAARRHRPRHVPLPARGDSLDWRLGRRRVRVTPVARTSATALTIPATRTLSSGGPRINSCLST